MENTGSSVVRYGELFFVATPEQGKITGGMKIEVINSSDNHSAVDLEKPSVTKPSASSPGDDHSEVRYDRSLGGKIICGTTYLV